MDKYKILFVCMGNVCRSPAAEGIMKEIVYKKGLQNQIEIDSAGTTGYHVGELPDSRMRKHGAKRGYNFNSHSRLFTANDFDDFDIILTMDDRNYSDVLRLSSDLASEVKVHRVVEFLKKYDYDHIPDPYYSGADGFELVLDLLEDACGNFMVNIEEEINNK